MSTLQARRAVTGHLSVRTLAVSGLLLVAACQGDPARISEPAAPEVARAMLADGASPADSARLRVSSPSVPHSLARSTGCQMDWTTPGSIIGCAVPVPVVAPASPWLVHSGRQLDGPDAEQRAPITLTFSQPITGFALTTTGALKCSGDLGRIVAFRNGSQVAAAANTLIAPDDCGEDDLTFGVRGALPPDVSADRIVLEGVNPWIFDVLGVEGRAVLYYALSFGDAGSPLRASCEPATVTRGDEVRCSVSYTGPTPFTLLRRLAVAAPHRIEDRRVESVAAGGVGAWVGAAVLSSAVSFEVEVIENGQPRTLFSDTARFVVTPRAWPPWAFTTMAFRAVTLDLGGAQPGYPVPGTRLGVFQADFPSAPGVARPVVGPNAGLAFLAQPYTLSDYLVGVHPAIDIGTYPATAPSYTQVLRWVQDQNGVPGGTCLAAAIPVLRAAVERHEGVPPILPNSHPGVGNSVFRQLQPERDYEALVTPRSDAELLALVEARNTALINNPGPYRNAQRQFDANDYPNVFASAGCPFDFNPNDT